MSSPSSNQKSRRGYRRLLSQQFSFNFSQKHDETKNSSKKNKEKAVDSHPVLKILDAPTKRATSRPEFLRYLEYVKEAGSWDADSERPSIYYK
ncbi:hypothetical protein FCM35_KLT21426 [Carex littledalei]|uniref:Uncharacterized protein n=1 Tax=Carex littledalei TaxID=544730 RepID=A0A833RBA0_9POAL|nr:hypothetical protein FCM35_KLT21426 [Carex littledalei]